MKKTFIIIFFMLSIFSCNKKVSKKIYSDNIVTIEKSNDEVLLIHKSGLSFFVSNEGATTSFNDRSIVTSMGADGVSKRSGLNFPNSKLNISSWIDRDADGLPETITITDNRGGLHVFVVSWVISNSGELSVSVVPQ